VDAGLAASIFHFGEVKIRDLKLEMQQYGIPARII
jgi:imidazole glycerol phosphate synthase subunit HisF